MRPRLASAVLACLLVACGKAPQAAVPAPTPEASAGDSGCPTLSAGTRAFAIVPDQSEASYRVQEKIFSRQIQSVLRIVGVDNVAVGKTRQVRGEILLGRDGQIPAMKVTVDLSTLTSNNDLRDQKIREGWLESSRYPLATFVAGDVPAVAVAPDGQEVSFKVPGTMTIHDTSRPLTFDVKAAVSGQMASGTATTSLKMRDFGFNPPSVGGTLEVLDGVTVTVNFTASEERCPSQPVS